MGGKGFQAVLFDVDGVLIDSPHERAWRETLEELMATEWQEIAPRTSYSPLRFTTAVYQEVIAGKPREAGAQAALEWFGVPDAGARARVYGERKQALLLRLIKAGEVAAFPDAVRFLIGVKSIGLAVAAASSSRNADALLASIQVDAFAQGPLAPGGVTPNLEPESGPRPQFLRPGMTLLDLFDVRIPGADMPRGKPYPDLFLAAAAALGAAPERCLVVEDAPSGVQAAKAGGMTALGVARLEDEALLVAAGADRVVASLDEIDVETLPEGRLTARAA